MVRKYALRMLRKLRPVLMTLAVFLTLIVSYQLFISVKPTAVDVKDLDVEIYMSDSTYLLGEEIEVDIYLYNRNLKAVKIDQGELSIGVPVTISSDLLKVYKIHHLQGVPTVIRGNSRVLLGKTVFRAEATGVYTIDCLGQRKIINIVFIKDLVSI